MLGALAKSAAAAFPPRGSKPFQSKFSLQEHIAMRYHMLGLTGLFVSELCLGTMTFGSGEGMWSAIGGLGQGDAERLVGVMSPDQAAGITHDQGGAVIGRARRERPWRLAREGA